MIYTFKYQYEGTCHVADAVQSLVIGRERCDGLYLSLFVAVLIVLYIFPRGQRRKLRMSNVYVVFGDTAAFLYQLTSVNIRRCAMVIQ